jgi:hypothetical protein
VFIVKGLKVLCFDTLLQVFILKVDSGGEGGLAEVFVGSRVLLAIFLGNAGRKGVRWLARYFMGYYTIWLAVVKRSFVPFWELENETRSYGPHDGPARESSFHLYTQGRFPRRVS